MELLSKNILTTVVYYDILDYPLTAFEIWKYLTVQGEKSEGVNLGKIEKALGEPILAERISRKAGFCFLKGRENLIDERLRRNKLSQRKMKLARKAAKILSFVPYVRMAALTGRVAMKNAERKSDLDFLVVLKGGRIFIGRVLVTIAIHLFGIRRHTDKITDRVCLNYFITDEALEIASKDIYSSSEYSFIFPLFDLGTFRTFQEKNLWIKGFKPNFTPDEIKNIQAVNDNFFSRGVRNFGERFFNFVWIENYFKRWQIGRIARDPRTHQKGSAVMAGSDCLVFLPDPHGPRIYGKFRKRIDDIF